METDFFGASKNDRAPAFVSEGRADAEVLHVFGELDFAAVSEFESALACNVSLGRVLVVDLTPCSYIEASALGVLVRARAALGDLLRVEVAQGGIVHRVFEIAKVPHEVVFEAAYRPLRLVRRAGQSGPADSLPLRAAE